MNNSRKSMLQQWCSSGCAFFSLALWFGVTVCFIGCWDQVAAVTLFPYWSWALIGGLAAYFAQRLSRKRWTWVIFVLWLITTLCFADNAIPMLRLLKQPSPSEGRLPTVLRVVTLNCAGSAGAAAELGALKPDLVLLQEIPSTNDLARLTHLWFGDAGSFVAGFDCAILARDLPSATGYRRNM
jgi:hypothetical protein